MFWKKERKSLIVFVTFSNFIFFSFPENWRNQKKLRKEFKCEMKKNMRDAERKRENMRDEIWKMLRSRKRQRIKILSYFLYVSLFIKFFSFF